MKISISFSIPDFFPSKKKFVSKRPFHKSRKIRLMEWLWEITPGRLKIKIVTILGRQKPKEFIYILRNFKPIYIFRLIYLIGYGIVYVVGAIAEFIWFLITYPFVLFYRIMSSRPMTFVMNMVLLATITGLIFFYDEFNNTKILVDNAVMKLGGEESLFCHEDEIRQKLKDSVVRIVGGEGEGSGFVYMNAHNKSFILTNYHVIQYEPSPKVIINGNYFREATIIAANKDKDIAVLSIDDNLPILEWGNSSSIHVGEILLSVGYPYGSEILGEATVTTGSYNGLRNDYTTNNLYLQTDGKIMPGMSGGAMTDVCGKVMGMNTLGGEGIGMAIPSEVLQYTIESLADSTEPRKDVKIIDFKPEESPVEAVKAFYNYIKLGKYEKAYDLLGEKYREETDFGSWKEGYTQTLQTSIISAVASPDDDNRVNVKLHAVDINGEVIFHTYYEGSWRISQKDGKYILEEGNISVIEDPSFWWFYDDAIGEEIY